MYTDPQILYYTTLSLDMNARHRYFMHWYHHYTDIVVHWTWYITLYTDHCYYMYSWYTDMFHGLLLHIYVPLVHGYTHSRNTAFYIIVIIVTWMLGTQLCHVYTSLFRMYILFLYSCHMDHCLYCMYIQVFLLHDCFPLLIFPLLDTWAADMRCVELSATWIQATGATSRIPHLLFPFPVILFYAINRTQVLLSCYLYHALYLFLLRCALEMKYNKVNLGMGETWRLIRSYRVDVLDPYCYSHCRGW